jgi:DNA-binding transcriptional LysR family regulator
MQLGDLGAFVHVATTGSFTRGARLSHVSPPAMTKAIQRLEQTLGCELFVRTTRSVRLTDAGRLVLDASRRVFAEMETLQATLDDLGGVMRGPIRVAAMEVFSRYLVPAALAQLGREAPELRPELYEMLPEEMAARIAEGEIDIAFTIGAPRGKRVTRRSIGASRGVVVCGAAHPLYAGRRIDRARAAELTWVVPRFWGRPGPSLDQLDAHVLKRRIGATIELLQSGVELVATGNYLGYFPEVSVRPELDSGKLRALRGLRGLPPFELQVLYAGEAPQKSSARRLLALVEKLVGHTA